MWRAVDNLIVRALPLVPKQLVERFARPYVAGSELVDACGVVSQLQSEGALATVDILGEEINSELAARATRDAYLELLGTFDCESLDAGVSIKLTALGLNIDGDQCRANLRRVVTLAARLGRFVRIDMEDHRCTDATLVIYREMKCDFANLGVVLQSMLHRTVEDAAALASTTTNVRLCKGIYREPASIAYQHADEIRRSYLDALRTLLEGGSYVALATHDRDLIRASLALVSDLGLGPQRYELQMLLGVLPELRRQLIEQGHRVRVYVPYGAHWYAYCIRRLRENPAVARSVIRAVLLRR